jgi:hypothetical protein
MSVSAVGSSTNATNVQSSAGVAVAAANQRAADGDYKTKGPGRSAVKDSDGDYKRLSTAQSTSSSSVQAAVANLGAAANPASVANPAATANPAGAANPKAGG